MRPVKIKWLIGIDEVGRGPVAGPVVLGACCVPVDFNFSFCGGIRDSKKLSEKMREVWDAKIQAAGKAKKLSYAVSFVSSRLIDARGLSWAIKKALVMNLKKLKVPPKNTRILLDGGLKAPAEFIFQKTIIKGDEKEPVISMASIVAKVARDRHMKKLSKKYPNYDFQVHKGYGTRRHYQKIKKYGLSTEHRRSFLSSVLKSL